MTATLYSWTVTVDNGQQIPLAVAITAATSTTTGEGSLWQLLDANGRPVYEAPVGRIISAQRGAAQPQPAETAEAAGAAARTRIMERILDGRMSVDAGRRALGLKPFGLPETEFVPVRTAHDPVGPIDHHGHAVPTDSTTDALLDAARMTGSERLAGMALGAQRIRDMEHEALASVTFDALMKSWDEACCKAWDDGYREPRAVLPDSMWPRVAQLVNPVTRNVVTIERIDPFPVEAAADTVPDAGQGASSVVLNFTGASGMTKDDIRKLTDRISDGLTRHAGHERRTPTAPDINRKAAAFAEAHGSFMLQFDARRNSESPQSRPWTLSRTGKDGLMRSWGGFTAEEVIDFASGELTEEGE